jgi:protein SOK2
MRDDDDREQESTHTPAQNGEPNYEYKRRKTITDTAVNGVVGASVGLQSVTTGAVPRRR